jgi:predicted esterase
VGVQGDYAFAMHKQSGGRSSGLRRVALFCCLTFGLGAGAPLTPGLHQGVTIEQASSLTTMAEIVRRAFTPLTAERIAATHSISGQPVDAAKESFVVYVPERKPPQGYALLVFVPPWNEATLPAGWASVLDEKGVIFVSAANSGNDANVQFRRMALAVIAARQLMRDYGVDPARVLVGGFSGGSRVALRLALAYPDVFHGALLNSGSDPVGTAAIPLPPADLFHQFQENSRLYYATGDLDTTARSMQAASEASLQSWCVFDAHATTLWHAGHTTVDQRVLSSALDTLLDPTPEKHEGLAECRARIQGQLAADVQHVDALIASGDKPAARQALNDLDTKFGGLGAERVLELEKKLVR